MVRRNLLINNILSELQNEVCYEENQTYRFHKGNHGPNRFHESKGTIYSKKKKFNAPMIALVHQYGRRVRSWSHNVACHDVM